MATFRGGLLLAAKLNHQRSKFLFIFLFCLWRRHLPPIAHSLWGPKAGSLRPGPFPSLAWTLIPYLSIDGADHWMNSNSPCTSDWFSQKVDHGPFVLELLFTMFVLPTIQFLHSSSMPLNHDLWGTQGSMVSMSLPRISLVPAQVWKIFVPKRA